MRFKFKVELCFELGRSKKVGKFWRNWSDQSNINNRVTKRKSPNDLPNHYVKFSQVLCDLDISVGPMRGKLELE